jgi:hypothetical protein
MMEKETIEQTSFIGFVARTTILHVVTYFLFGALFAFYNPFHQGVHTIELFPEYQFLFKPMESAWVTAGAILQIIRGPVLMGPLYYFRSVFLGEKNGWLKLFLLMAGLTCIGAVVAGPGSLEGYFYTTLPMELHTDGLPEVLTQMFTFSYLVTFLESHKSSKKLVFGLTAVFIVIVALLGYAVTLI